MLNLPFPPKNLAQVDLEGYPRRAERGLLALIEATGLPVEAEMARFRFCYERLLAKERQGPAADMLMQARQTIIGLSPIIFEFVTTFDDNRLKGVGYLTQGRPTGTLPINLGNLLAFALELHFAGGGATEEATLLTDVFKLSFPNLKGLVEFSALSQGMIVGVVPKGDKLALKVYFNTRLDPAGNHRDRVTAILNRCGLDGLGLYDLLYAENDGARFHGIGIDLGSDSSRRAKLYVRLTAAQLEPSLTALEARLLTDAPSSEASIIEPVLKMRDAVGGDALVDEVELAVALRSDGAPTAKVTIFWASQLVGKREETQLAGYLSGLGYPAQSLDAAMCALSENAERAVSQKHPLHALGIEVPVGERPKINVYLQPIL